MDHIIRYEYLNCRDKVTIALFAESKCTKKLKVLSQLDIKNMVFTITIECLTGNKK